MRKIMVFAALVLNCATVFAQKKTSVEIFVEKGIGASFEQGLGRYNSAIEEPSTAAFFFDMLLYISSDVPFDIPTESEYDHVVQQDILGKRSIIVGARIQPSFLKKVQVGAKISHFEYDLSKSWNSGQHTKDTETFTTVMPELQLSWFTKDNITMYSSGGIGLTKRTYQQAKSPVSRTKINISSQMNFVGARYQHGHLGAHIEVGYGAQGIVKGGFSVAF